MAENGFVYEQHVMGLGIVTHAYVKFTGLPQTTRPFNKTLFLMDSLDGMQVSFSEV
jgi:hypothetical protein